MSSTNVQQKVDALKRTNAALSVIKERVDELLKDNPDLTDPQVMGVVALSLSTLQFMGERLNGENPSVGTRKRLAEVRRLYKELQEAGHIPSRSGSESPTKQQK